MEERRERRERRERQERRERRHCASRWKLLKLWTQGKDLPSCVAAEHAAAEVERTECTARAEAANPLNAQLEPVLFEPPVVPYLTCTPSASRSHVTSERRERACRERSDRERARRERAGRDRRCVHRAKSAPPEKTGRRYVCSARRGSAS